MKRRCWSYHHYPLGLRGRGPTCDQVPEGGAPDPWGSLGSDFFYEGYTPHLALVMPDFIGFLRSELWGSKNAFTSGHS
jgi:hypothetical protein